MNILQHFGRGKSKKNGNSDHVRRPSGPKMDIKPGQVEEAVHYMSMNGAIDLSELYFEALGVDEFGNDIDPISSSSSSQSNERHHPQQPQHFVDNSNRTVKESFLDIAVFEVPERCTSRTCDLSRYGVGKLTYVSGMKYLNLCSGGRLNIDPETFRGYHTNLMVPQNGPMPHKVRYGKVVVPAPNRNYEVMVANCNDYGRKVRLTGQVIFDFDSDPAVQLDSTSLAVLTLIALSVCMIFSACSIRIRWGNGNGTDYMVVNNGTDDDDNRDVVENVTNTSSPSSYSDNIIDNNNINGDNENRNSGHNSRSYDSSSVEYPEDGIELGEFSDSASSGTGSDYGDEHDLRLHTVS